MTGIPIIPRRITVHLGRPSAYAANVTVPFIDYIKNVASSEIYPTWPDAALRANIYAQVTFALNRVYTEWYRSRGYDFDITNSTSYDQAFVNGREIFSNISDMVDELFNDYVRRQGRIEPLFTQFCNGTTVTCGGLSQWGTVELARQGMTPYEILQYYYGQDIEIVVNAPVGSVNPSYPGYPLGVGAGGRVVRILQLRLNRVSRNYPAIPKVEVDGVYGEDTARAVRTFQEVFGLTPDGIVGRATWYKLESIYVAVKNLSELQGEGYSYEDFSAQFPSVLEMGFQGRPVAILQHRLNMAAAYYDTIPEVTVDGIFGDKTRQAVAAFQNRFGLAPDGVVGEATWEALYRVYQGILNSILTPAERPVPWDGQTLSYGAQGERVLLLQRYLNTVADVYSLPKVNETGYFGNDTRNAVRLFQELADLNPDGVVGEATWRRLSELYADIVTGLTRRAGQFPGSVLRG